MPQKYEDLVKGLNVLYIEWQNFIDGAQDDVESFVNKHNDYLHDNFDWVWDLEGKRYPDEALNYLMNDPIYKNKILRYKTLIGEVISYIWQYKEKAFILYLKLNQVTLIDPLPKIIEEKYKSIDPSFIKDYEGIYINGDSDESVYLYVDRGLLLWGSTESGRQFYFEGLNLSGIERDSICFVYNNKITVKFNRGLDHDVTGLFLYNTKGSKIAEYTKQVDNKE